MFADDIAICGSFQSTFELHSELKKVGQVLDVIEMLGLPICDDKSHAIFAIGGSSYDKTQASVQRKTSVGTHLLIPRSNRKAIEIPFTDRIKHLGVFVSFRHLEKLTMEHRIQCATNACRRLSRWLHSKRISIPAKLHMWRSCVYSVLQYGLLATGATIHNIEQFQNICVGMLRKIVEDHPFRTQHTHWEALPAYSTYWPLPLLQRAADKLLRSQATRSNVIASSDILHSIDWSHLPVLLQLIVNLQATGPLGSPQIQPQDASPVAVFACNICAFQTNTMTKFRRHYTVAHNQRTGRTHPVPSITPCIAGLPHCQNCFHSFSSWHSFFTHIESRTCQAQPHLASQPAHPPHVFLLPEDLTFLKSQGPGESSSGLQIETGMPC